MILNIVPELLAIMSHPKLITTLVLVPTLLNKLRKLAEDMSEIGIIEMEVLPNPMFSEE